MKIIERESEERSRSKQGKWGGRGFLWVSFMGAEMRRESKIGGERENES